MKEWQQKAEGITLRSYNLEETLQGKVAKLMIA